MITPRTPEFVLYDEDIVETLTGRIAVVITPDGKLDRPARRVDRLTKGAIKRLIENGGLEEVESGDVISLEWPVGLEAKAVDVVVLAPKASEDEVRKTGAKLGAKAKGENLHVLAGKLRHRASFALGTVLRDYDFVVHKSKEPETERGFYLHLLQIPDADVADHISTIATGVFTTRNLVNEPANHLTTTEFADRIAGLSELGLKIIIREEGELEKLGMGAMLCVGQGSDSPSKLAIMEWRGGKRSDPPLALVGKGVVFDTGGISLKPAAGMEDMTMDMGGAAVVTGVMETLAMRKAKANVIGLVGLVENMPSGNATRPGDVVTSMKGDTIEVINTDAEGRLVLADVLWYAQHVYKPAAIINLATLTGAIIIGLGHENAGVFSNDNDISRKFLNAARAENEGAWPMPMDDSYAESLKSRIADVKNVGGRPAGSITAAKFLERFIQEGTPWIHLDIAGVASVKTDTAFAPKGATGWGVMSLNRLVADYFEDN